MADKPKVKNAIGMREMKHRQQRLQDEERLSQINYQGKLIEMEKSMLRSQLDEVKKGKPRDPLGLHSSQSQPSLHLPPIKPRGDPAIKDYLNDVRGRDYKAYMVRLRKVKENNENQSLNAELKKKLFREKLKKQTQDTKSQCQMHWHKLEELMEISGKDKEVKYLDGSIITDGQNSKSAAKFGKSEAAISKPDNYQTEAKITMPKPEAEKKPVSIKDSFANSKKPVQNQPAQGGAGRRGDDF